MVGKGGRSGGGGAGRGGGKNSKSVMFLKPNEPTFLRRMKEELGFKEGPTIDTKREALPVDEDMRECDDEKPIIVVVKPGDLSSDEVDRLGGLKNDDDSDGIGSSVKLVFRKPNKRVNEEELNKRVTQSKKIKNKTLLSFDDEENDD